MVAPGAGSLGGIKKKKKKKDLYRKMSGFLAQKYVKTKKKIFASKLVGFRSKWR